MTTSTSEGKRASAVWRITSYSSSGRDTLSIALGVRTTLYSEHALQYDTTRFLSRVHPNWLVDTYMVSSFTCGLVIAV